MIAKQNSLSDFIQFKKKIKKPSDYNVWSSHEIQNEIHIHDFFIAF